MKNNLAIIGVLLSNVNENCFAFVSSKLQYA